MLDEMLKGAPYVILSIIQRLQSEGRQPSQTDLTRATGYATRTIQYALDTLEEKGYIRVDRSKRKNRYEVIRPI